MVDKKFLDSINLKTRSTFQGFLSKFLVGPNYKISKVDIKIENIENIPENETVIFAMNHTDRFNYMPFQYTMRQMHQYPETTVWVKAKYYSNAIMKKVLHWGNTLPVPSKSYIIENMFRKTFNRKINSQEYRLIKDILDMKVNVSEAMQNAGQDIRYLFSEKWQQLVHSKYNFMKYMETYYGQMMDRVAEISKNALFEKNLSLLIFPEGTRSVKLVDGKTGIAQVALSTGKKVIPVGCNGSENIYPGNSPFAKGGQVIYRVGEPMTLKEDFKDFEIKESFKLFSNEANEKYAKNFGAVSGMIMDRIQELLDKKYREKA